MIIRGNYVAVLAVDGTKTVTGVDIVHRYGGEHEARGLIETNRIYEGNDRICACCGETLEPGHYAGRIRADAQPSEDELAILETLFDMATVQVSAITDGVGSCGHLLDTIIRFKSPPTVLDAVARRAN